MSFRMLIGCALWLVPAMSLSAEDAALETSLQIYKVGDLVSRNAVNKASMFPRDVSLEEWAAEHVETIESLERLTSFGKIALFHEAGGSWVTPRDTQPHRP